ncbi:RsfA family transcriptional regulator [Bacillus weihaiensis]|uniref:RsfA family transcriptional regulator n=1 Tax=Bacillus weihaiensis TaxID=1547283 RepID=UPI0023543592|nr:RsfA family transcriptional regulator [Bacillus weihaiensis]
MTTTRQDAWTQDEDLLLAEVVLRHIREGETQLAAFEEVGKKLSRTAAACGFRWNSYVRKQYKTGIELAKKQRKELRSVINNGLDVKEEKREEVIEVPEVVDNTKQTINQENTKNNKNTNAIKDLITFLKQYEEAPAIHEIQAENEKLTKKINELENHIEKIQEEKKSVSTKLHAMEAEYHELVKMMEHVRKIVILQRDDVGRKVK